MPGKIFVNYRRDDARDMAARIRDRLAATFGDANVFMDVDDLMPGQRFEDELEKALAQTDVFLAVIGPRWLELLAERQASGERDYVREEIAGALQRRVVVIPVLVERTPLPRAAELSEVIRGLVLHQTHEVARARFGRDVAELVEAIRFARQTARARAGGGGLWARWVGAAALAAVLVLGVGLLVFPRSESGPAPEVKLHDDQAAKIKADPKTARAEEAWRAEVAAAAGKMFKELAEAETDHAEKAWRSAVAAARKKADEEAEAKGATEDAERRRLALLKAEQERVAEDASKRQQQEETRRFKSAPATTPGAPPMYKLDPSQTHVVELSNLFAEENCHPDILDGHVVARQFDEAGIMVTGVTLEHDDGQRSYANVGVDIKNVPRLTGSWVASGLQALLRPGNKVSLGVLLCGAAGRVVMIHSIASLTPRP
jgi:hypothetical protein